jgi:hypothetical protein
MTVRTFHSLSSRLAFFGSLDLEGHDFLFDLGALALGAPELHLVIFRKGQHEVKLATTLLTSEIVAGHKRSPSCERIILT